MKACPNCHFLVTDDVEQCSVCKQPIGVDAPAADEARWTGTEAAPASGLHQRSRRPVATRGRRSNIGLLSVVGVLVLAAVVGAFVYRQNTGTDVFSNLFGLNRYTISVEDSDWRTYTDPGGRFSLEMPGKATATTESVSTGAGSVTADLVLTEEPAVTALGIVPIPPGATPDLPAALEGFAEGGEASGMVNAIVTQSNQVTTPFGSGIRGRVDGLVDGKEAVMAALVFVNGSNLYVLTTVGPAPQTALVLDIQDRMATSLAVPAAA